MPAIEIAKTVYLGQDSGAGCPNAFSATGGGNLAVGVVGTPITWCFRVTNTGNTTLDGVSIVDPPLGITDAAMDLLAGIQPLPPGESLVLYYGTTIQRGLANTATVAAVPIDSLGNMMSGVTAPAASDVATVDAAPKVPLDICHHNCPDILRDGGAGGLDFLQLISNFPPGTIADPPNEDLTVTLSNAAGLIWSETLPAGSLRARGLREFRYFDEAAKRDGGYHRVRMYYTPDRSHLRVYIRAFGDMSQATLANMTLEIRLGDDVLTTTGPWMTDRRNGWRRNHR